MEAITLAGRYRIVEELGSSAASVLYRARDMEDNRSVALKILRPEWVAREELVARFLAHGEAIRDLPHRKYIAAVFQVGQEGDTVFLAREYVEGVNLAQKLQEVGGRLSPEEAREIIREVCAGLHPAHQKQIWHLGLTPRNIILAADGRVKITDFGLSFLALAGTLEERDFSGISPEILAWAAPEQFWVPKAEDHRTDIYQVGLLLFYLLFGFPPFSRWSFSSYREAQLQDPPPQAPEVITKALAKNPGDRYQGVRELEEALEALSTLPPVLQVSPPQVTLPPLPPGQPAELVLQVCNAGGGELQGTVEIPPAYAAHLRAEPQEFRLPGLPPQPSLAPEAEAQGAEIRLTLDSTGLEAGRHEVPVRILSNGGEAVVSLVFQVGLPLAAGEEFSVSPAALDFGRLRWRSRKTGTLTLTNPGPENVQGLIRVSHPEHLRLEGVPPSSSGTYEFSLPGGQRAVLGISLLRGELPAGEFQGEVVISLRHQELAVPVSAVFLAPWRLSLPRRGLLCLKGALAFLLGLLLLYAGFSLLKPRWQAYRAAAEVRELLDQGRFSEAWGKLRALKAPPEDLAQVKAALTRSLSLHLEFWYEDETGTQRQLQSLTDRPRIPSGNGYRLTLRPGTSTYLYIFQMDSSGRIQQLFPNPRFSPLSNPVEGGRTFNLPEPESRLQAPFRDRWFWFTLNRTRGEEKIFLVAAPWPARDLERLQRVSQEKGLLEQWKIREEFLRHLYHRLQARRQNLPGILFEEITLIHLP